MDHRTGAECLKDVNNTLHSGGLDPRIRAPFRLIWAEEDTALRRELTYGMQPYFEQPVDIRYLPGVGHFVTDEAPELVTERLLAHLASHR